MSVVHHFDTRTWRLDRLFGVKLSILPAEDVHPHEIPDSPRLQRLLARIGSERLLRDPVLVADAHGTPDFVLLDGTNRLAALKYLRCPYVLAQVVDYGDHHCVQLRTWAHVAHVPIRDLLDRAASIPGLMLDPIKQDQADLALERAGAVAVMSYAAESWLIHSDDHHRNRSACIRGLVDLYEGRMSRESRDDEPIAEKLRELSAREGLQPGRFTLITFPRFNRAQVSSLARHGTLIPSGITRHIIRCGRALRVNLPLDVLDGDHSLNEARALLQRHLDRSSPRRYLEPTILFDS